MLMISLTLCLLCSLLPLSFGGGVEEERHYEYAPYDGWYNNLAHPSWGAADTQMYRKLPAAYSDGVYEPAGEDRPNPFEISDATMSGHTGEPSLRGKTAFLVFYGQQVVEEILDAQRPGCPPEYFNIKIPKDHMYNPDKKEGLEMPLLRSRYDMTTGLSPNNPRQQINEITPYFDGGLFYGPNKAWSDALRSFKGGRLAALNDSDSRKRYFPAKNDIRLPFANPPPPKDHYLKPIKRFFKIGNPRGNENPFLLSFGVLWFRYHNYQADRIQRLHPDWKDEKVFNEARKWTTAIHQHISVNTWLPSWLGESLDEYKGYDSSIQPAISHEFQSAAMRFGHTMVPPGVYRRGPLKDDGNCKFYDYEEDGAIRKAIRTCQSYWNPQDPLVEEFEDKKYDGVDLLMMGMASQVAEKEDNIITEDLRGHVFGPLDFSRRDLMAINIQRGRDHGLPDYNTARVGYGLKPVEHWVDINRQLAAEKPELFMRLEDVYKNISKVDIWVGGILESGQKDGVVQHGPGPLFRAIIKDQFRRIRDGDRFWFENTLNGLFTDDEIVKIKNTTIKDIVLLTTNVEEDDIQDDPFEIHDSPCPAPDQLNGSMPTHLAKCPMMQTFDYFEGSTVSYILSFLALGLILIGIIFALIYIANRRQKMLEQKRENFRPRNPVASLKNGVIAKEWISYKERERQVLITFDLQKHHIVVKSDRGKLYRLVDCKLLTAKASDRSVKLGTSVDKRQRVLLVKVPHEYDLILTFDDVNKRSEFKTLLEEFLTDCGYGVNNSLTSSEKELLKDAFTKESRQELLNRFFRTTAAHAFNYTLNSRASNAVNTDVAKDIVNCELTKHEFAEALGIKPSSTFVENMFNLVDRDGNGVLSFREFLDVIIIFTNGSAEQKAQMLFNMYDLDQSGFLDIGEFKQMLRSMLDLANDSLEDTKVDKLVDKMFKEANFATRSELNFDDFMRLMNEYKDVINYASLDMQGVPRGNNGAAPPPQNRGVRAFEKSFRSRNNEIQENRMRMSQHPTQGGEDTSGLTSDDNSNKAPAEGLDQTLLRLRRFFENYRLHVFWVSLYTLVAFGIFIERAYYYSVEREHAGLRRIAGYGVTVTRGAASGMMFTYSTLLVTMCRNMITYLRETPVNRYVPLDEAVSFHKYVAWLALFFTVMHIIGHGINFYHIATQTANDLSCLFRNFFHATDELPKFHYWAWQTITGFTGILLTVVVMLMYVFAIQYSRRQAFRLFWITHNMYIVLFILMILHGAGRLVQPPFMHYFMLGPAILFTIDKLISLSRKKIEIPVIKAELLPSEVTYLEVKKPQNFEYKSGQWVRISCSVLGGNEYHPFTISSAPHEPNLSVHIRAIGPWTMNLRNTYDPNNIKEHALPKIHLDGPYGEGHQEWFKYDVSILVGGGIGVTPFASIIKDLAHRSSLGSAMTCKKVYFIWITRTQKQFEWMTDIIRAVEDNDTKNLLSCHIFVTQFKEKFDIRTTMLYICERYFQKISNRSLFTGLRSITHFGRPKFDAFFTNVKREHRETQVFGVFSCGPPPMTKGVEQACATMNKSYDSALFQHHFENF